jgi:hypothetical protein
MVLERRIHAIDRWVYACRSLASPNDAFPSVGGKYEPVRSVVSDSHPTDRETFPTYHVRKIIQESERGAVPFPSTNLSTADIKEKTGVRKETPV